jgi:flavodoxin I
LTPGANVAEVNSAFLTVMVRIFGYAAESIAARLVRKGGTQAANPAGFFVTGTEGPLKEGELERAAAWAKSLPL